MNYQASNPPTIIRKAGVFFAYLAVLYYLLPFRPISLAYEYKHTKFHQASHTSSATPIKGAALQAGHVKGDRFPQKDPNRFDLNYLDPICLVIAPAIKQLFHFHEGYAISSTRSQALYIETLRGPPYGC